MHKPVLSWSNLLRASHQILCPCLNPSRQSACPLEGGPQFLDALSRVTQENIIVAPSLSGESQISLYRCVWVDQLALPDFEEVQEGLCRYTQYSVVGTSSPLSSPRQYEALAIFVDEV